MELVFELLIKAEFFPIGFTVGSTCWQKEISKEIDIFLPFINYMRCVNVATIIILRLSNVNDFPTVPTLETTVFLKKDDIVLKIVWSYEALYI